MGVIPAPMEVRPAPGQDFRLGPDTAIFTEPGSAEARRIGEYLAALLRPATGYPIPVTDENTATITLRLGGGGLGPEGYRLTTNVDGVSVRADAPAGLFAGVQTLRQLLPADIESPALVAREWTVPGGAIADRPRFPYRGAMLDLARHFHTLDEIKAFVDQIAAYKVNHLHLHLTDDQGWRIEILSWPKLTAGDGGSGVDGAGGGYLTQAEYAELVAYAAERYVTVVPEIDMPGHTNAAQVAYPELNGGIAATPRTDTAVGYSSLRGGDEVTYAFVEDVVRELAALTPGPYLHVGGDEADATPDGDYRTFMRRIIPIVERHGKKVLGWHEIAKADPPASVVPQFWGSAGTHPEVAAAATRGARVLMSPSNRAYLDMKYTPDTPLGLDWAGYIEVRDAYEWDPAAQIEGVGEAHVLGVEAPLWSETMRTLADVETMTYPRLPAIAEVGWSAVDRRDWESFRHRVAAHAPRWTLRGTAFHRSPQIPWEYDQ
ncbi:beta-N-acetylhexosaminidase [Phytohabitans aurantiacus]|uniref:beta-N-acetylhexosaminidase n=1 Tax=Phytohabitans aurantiacus TaxID=3016789 RepID=A0ABQ5R4B0_9ACTN|nr:beta-N-acetylhexosaminidase [Phytohabitans aurantiacus]GLI01622.1 beta-N-acetylhexosaminidase [Phytohabitans aurantiacus]